jgi:UPF0755 protein
VTRDTDGDWAPRETSRSSSRHGRVPQDYDPDAPAGPYVPQPDPYTAPGGYAQPGEYGPPGGYAQPGQYDQPGGYAPAPSYQPDAYAQPDGYAQPDTYGAPNAYGAPGGYAEPGPYGAPVDPLTAPGRFAAAPADPTTQPGHATGPGQTSGPGRRRRADSYPGAEAPPARESQPGRRRRPDSYPPQDPDAQTDPSYRPGPPARDSYGAPGSYAPPGREPSALDTPAPYQAHNGHDGPAGYPPRNGYAPSGPHARPEPGPGPGRGAGPAGPPSGGRPPQTPPGYGQDAYRQEDPYGRPGASGEFAGPGGYDQNGYGRAGTRDEPAGPRRNGYAGRPGAGDELTGPQRNGYRQAGPADQGTGPQRGGYGGPAAGDELAALPDANGFARPGTYRRADDSSPYGTPAGPPPDGERPFQWQPGADEAAGPEGLAALPPPPGRTGPQSPPPGRTARQQPPRGRDWDSQPPDWGQGPDTGGFAAAGPAPASPALGGARRPDDSGIGLQSPADQVGRGSWPEDAPEEDDDDWDDEPSRIGGLIPGLGGGRDSGGRPRRRVGRRIAPILAPILALVVFAALGLGGFRLYQHFQSKDFTGPGTGEVTVQVLAGDTATSLAPRLVKAGVVASASSFISAAKANNNPTGLEPGFFAMHKHMNSALAYKLLLNPSSRVQSVVAVPEGLRESQILTLLEKKAGGTIPASQFTAAANNLAALGLPSYVKGRAEGYLFPATYDFNPGTSPTAMLKAMVARYNQESASINLPAAAKAVNVTPNEVITVASILEAEAGKAKYFGQVAEVIYNRLNRGMPLQVDSTINYALNRFGVSLTQTQLHVNSPYNSFLHKGLPPTPIDSPGDAAIKAALHPDHGDLLYFVTVNLKTGLTLFTDSPTQFDQDVALCQRNKAC